MVIMFLQYISSLKFILPRYNNCKLHVELFCVKILKLFVFFILQTSASLKFTVLNPKGRIWTMVAGGGASVIYADTVSFHFLWIILILAKIVNKGPSPTLIDY